MDNEKIKLLLANKDQLPPQARERLVQLLAERESLASKARAKDSFMAFVQHVWPNFIHGAHHARMAAAFERVARGECKRLIINMPPRHALTTDTPIPTTAGMKTMASISPGDYVFGPDGVPTQVLGKSEVFQNRQLYRVWTDDGAYIDTDGEHLWTVRLDRKRPKHQTYTTEQLWHRQNGAFLRTKRGGEVEIRPDATDPAKTRLPRLPDTAPAQHPLVDLPIDPYVLGVWLGDGTSLQAIITAHDADAAHIRPEFERRGFTTTDQATRMSFGVLGLKVKLRELGVLGNKHIPLMYLTASVQQRRDLLKGLMDTDGNVSKTGQCFFAQSDKRLCQQVQQLIRSLGIKANLLESRATLGGVDHGPTWKVSFYASDVFLLPRKEARTLKNERTFGRYIRVEKLSTTGDTQCIRVDREDGLFLAGEGYICTHNTKSEFASYLLPAWFLGLFPDKKIIQASNTGELAVGFGRKVRNLVDSEAYKEVFPQTELRADSKAAGRWSTSKNGEYFAIGVGGTVTGKGADCAYFLSKIHTKRGILPINYVRVGDYVYGYDHTQEKFVWTPVRAVSTQFKPELVNVGGVWLTPEHRVFSTRGYAPAAEVRDVAVRQVRERFSEGEEGSRACGSQVWSERQGVLFRAVLPLHQVAEGLFVRKPESPTCGWVQGMLPRWEACHSDVQHVQHVPQPLSSSVFGTCAADLAPLLHGEGFRVVDIQTGTGNFLADEVLVHNCLIIDDPHSEQEAALAEVNPEVYDKTYEWYTSGPRQRLQPGGAIILVMCMTGDTPVLMADGREKALRDIRAGDYVATFDKGRLATSKVNNWQSNGVDSIYKIQTRSGKILRANERHPFLVLNEGVLEWTRLNQLQVGDLLVSLKGVTDQHGRKQSRESVGHAKQKTVTTDATQTPPSGRLGIMGNGKRRPAASAGVVDPLSAVDCVPNTIRGNTSQRSHPSNPEHTTSSTVTVSLWHSTKQWLKNGITAAMSAVSRRRPRIPAPTGTTSCVSTTATTPGQCGGCYATTATSPLGMERHQAYLSELQRISDFTADPIVAITADGQAEVFDVEIDRTENFIANGVVSHNTRWSKKDLTGQVMKAAAQRGGEEWDVIEFPAILPSGNPLWPEFWPLPELEALRSELPNSKWMAQYQQNPTSDTSAIVKREWWKPWEASDPPPCDFILMSWDTAFEKNTRADYSACTTWGVFFRDDGTGAQQANVILLNAFRDRMEFPQLKQRAKAEYVEWNPDSIVIEKKATGAPLIYELRAAGIPVQEYTPSRGNDKISRLNAVADIFASGRVWAPNTRWAEEVIDEVASFPGGEHDDYVDSTSMALMRFRQGGFVRAAMDEDDTEFTRHLRRRRAPYY